MINTAFHWIDQGIAVIPIGYRSKRPNTRFLNNGEWKAFQSRLPCRDELRDWFANGLSNIAVVCGWQNIAIIDFDRLDAHDLWRQLYNVDTYQVSTGRGYHYYFFIDDYPPYTMKWFGGEAKMSGYCLAPPSIHPSGRKYQVVNDAPIMKIGSIYDIFPAGLFDQPTSPLQGKVESDIYSLAASGGASCDEINQRVRMTSFFSELRKSGNGWFAVQCPLHEDGRKWSGWINETANRYGCHACQSGSLSVIDLYMRLNQCDLITAMGELSCYQ